MTKSTQEYIYDSSSETERARLQALERLNDPASIGYLERVGVGPRWHCLEVGGGGGSIARWLCDRVGPEGRVVATDLDTRFLEEIDAPNLEVRRHDILSEELERDAFDVVHSRFVLEHLAEHRVALKRMVDAAKPGGWIVVEDVDMLSAVLADPDERPGVPASSTATAVEMAEKMMAMGRARGIHLELGRRLPELLVEAGLEDVGAEGRMHFVWNGSDEAQVGRLTLEYLTKVAVDAGRMTEEDRGRYMDLMTDPSVASYSPMRFGAWGRKPI